MSGTQELQTLKRGLQALVLLNDQGPTNLADLARALELPRANVLRILRTLIAEGYCIRMPNSRKYSLTALVQRLSGGFDEDNRLALAAREPVAKLSADLRWPIGLVTPRGTHMQVRIATDHDTPLALFKASPGYLTPMLNTTTGVLYLSLTDDKTRDELMDMLKADGAVDRFLGGEAGLARVMALARKDRYLVFDTNFPEGSLGVPIMSPDGPIGGLMMRYIKSAMARPEAVRRFLPKLRATADEIEANLALSRA